MTSFATLFVALSVAIVPTQARNGTYADIKVRGSKNEEAQVAATKINDKAFEGRTRIAVLPFEVKSSDKSLASQRTGMMDATLADLRYVPSLLVADRSDVLAAVKKLGLTKIDDAAITKLAAELGVSAILSGSVAADGDSLTVTMRLDSAPDKQTKYSSSASVTGRKDQIHALSDDSLHKVLEGVKVTVPADRVEEIKKVPTLKFKARAAADAGFAKLDAVLGKSPEDDSVRTANTEALELAEAALKADKEYIAAHMLKATCLYNLDQTDDLKDCLSVARKRNEPSRIDTLSALELEGDCLNLRDGKLPEAIKKYEAILAYDPGNMHALWSLIGIYTGEEFKKQPDSAKKVGNYAALIVAAHPHSSAAELFKPSPSSKK